MQEKLIAITLSLLILGQAWLVMRHVGTWIFPACMLGLFWFAYTFVPLVLMFKTPVEPMAVAFILLSCLAFSSTALVFNWHKAYAEREQSGPIGRFDTTLIRWAFYFLSAMVAASVIVNWNLQGFTLREIVFDFYQTSVKYVTLRARGDVSKNIVSQLGVVLTYAAAALGGLVYGARHKDDAGVRMVAVAMLPSMMVMLVEGNKGALFLAMALFWGGVLVCQVNNNEKKILSKNSWLKLLSFAVIALGLVSIAFWVRIFSYLDTGKESQKVIWYLLSYSCGHLYAFSDWFSWVLGKQAVSSYADTLNGGGFYTFMSVFRLLGDDRTVVPGIYGEYYVYGDSLQSNIYTIFRGLVIDFGLIGALIFWVVIGLISHAIFKTMVVGRRSALPTAYFIFLIGFFYTSFIISLLIWNSVFASFGITVAILLLNEWTCRGRGGENEKVSYGLNKKPLEINKFLQNFWPGATGKS